MDTQSAPPASDSSPAERPDSAPPARVLTDQVAIVTGAARGIGRAYALRLAALGAHVAVVDRDIRSFEEFEGERALISAAGVGAEVEAHGVRALEVEADLTDPQSTGQMVGQVLEEFGRVDVCVCNAGGGTGRMEENRASEIDLDQLQVVLARNLLTTVNTCAAVVPGMRQRRKGKLITVSSASGSHPHRDGGYSHYAAAKAAVISYTRNLAQELGPDGVTANAISPGAIATGRMLPKFEETDVTSITEKIALRRLGTPDDCADVLEFLATPLSDYVTGQVIHVDGGMLI